MNRTVLFTSPVQPIAGCSPDVYSWNGRSSPIKLHMSFINHPGLRFLEANLPGLRVLEYPDWAAFERAILDPPEILGISFYINETEIALEMAEFARARGVRQVWAGNYGGYSPEVESHFDRVITGWGEEPTANALGLTPRAPDELVHPAIYGSLSSNLLPVMSLHGLLYTSRGCPYTCNFCQTPDFYGKSQTVPLAAIDKVLRTYAEQGIMTVNVLDENFGIFPGHSNEVIRLLKKYNLRWLPLARADLMLANFDKWREHGLCGAHLGVESLNPASLTGANKKLNHQKSIALLRRLSEHNMIVQAFYIIGFEEDTVDSVRQDIELLSGLDVDIVQVQTVTPYPRTALRKNIDEVFGISEDNLSLYNSRNLVWNHPNISVTEMKELQRWADELLCTSKRALRTMVKLALYDCSNSAGLRGLDRLVRGQLLGRKAGLYYELRDQLKGAKEWGERGWIAYEEVTDPKRLRLRRNERPVPAPRRRLPVVSAV